MHEALAAIVARATGLDPAAVHIAPRLPLDHQSNRLYDVWASDHHLIAKEYLQPDEFCDAPIREYRALELLRPLHIAPTPVHYEPSTTPALGPIVVYEWMEGEMWDRHRPTETELAQLADVWLRMHTVSVEGLWPSRGYDRPLHEVETSFRARFQTYAGWVEAEFPAGQPAVDLCFTVLHRCRSVIDELAGCDPLLCFCRADPRFANVIRRPDGRLGLVDWEDSGLRDPARDLADLVTHANQEDLLSPDEWQAFLQPYLAVRGMLDPNLLHRTHLYLALFPIFWLAILVSRGVGLAHTGQLANWTANDLPINQRLRRYLVRALAWPAIDFSSQLETLMDVQFFPDR